MKKKKRKQNTPRHKRLRRNGRLQIAKHWIPKYEGKNLVKGYSKHFGVNKLCGLIELEMLGYSFKESYKQKLRDAEKQMQNQAEKRKKAKQQKVEWDPDSDETFAYIAGYTSGGAPFGITWEEQDFNTGEFINIEHEDLPGEASYWEERGSDRDSNAKDKVMFDVEDEELPF